MRLLRYTLTLCLMAFFGFTAQAQLQYGAGVALVGNFDLVGVQAKGQYAFNETWRAAADFTYLFPEFGSSWELNPNVHYIFSDDGAGKQLYALAGLGIWNVSVDLGGFGNVGVTDTGINVGAGANIPFGGVTGYAEAKFGIGGSEFGIAAGILFGN